MPPFSCRNFQGWSGDPPDEWRRLARQLPGLWTSQGLDMMSAEFAERALRGELDRGEERELFLRLLSLLAAYCEELRGDAALELERRLAEELVAKRLSTEPNERLLAVCRRYFTTSALDDLLARKDRSGK